METRITTTLCFCAVAMIAGQAAAEPRQFCVICKDPDQTYVCKVDTPHANPNKKGLRLYCIIRTAQDGGHKSCSVAKTELALCAGPVRAYSFQAPAIPPKLRDAIQRYRKARKEDTPDRDKDQPQKSGEQKTLIGVTGRAVKSSGRGIKKSGEAITGTAGAATGKVGKVARGAGKGVTRAARKVGSATKKTGSVVGKTAKSAIGCIWSLFKDCGSSQ